MAFGNALDMHSHIDTNFVSNVSGGVRLIQLSSCGYTGPGGVWVDGVENITLLTHINIQPAQLADMQVLQGIGGTTHIEDVRIVHINDGKHYIYPNDDGQFSDWLEFSDGREIRRWRVMSCDNRPWRTFCRAIVQRYRGSG